MSLKAQNISIGYTSPLLSNINLTAEKGEVIALIGANGAGKSTLLKTLANIIQPLSGNLFINNRKSTDYTAKELAKIIGFSGTHSHFAANLTVYELVALGRINHTNIIGSLKENDIEQIEFAINQCGLQKISGKKISQISDGQRQRAYIARLIAQQTQYLLFDEPTAFLDIEGKHKIVHLFTEIAGNLGKTVIFSTHDLKIAVQNADKIWLFIDKKIIEGTPEDLILNNFFEKLFDNFNIKFDNFTADFYVKKKLNKKISLIGNNNTPKFIWTKNALEKLGYYIDNQADTKIFLNKKNWQLQTSDSIFECKNISEIIKKLKL